MCFFLKINFKFNFQFFLSEKNLGTFLNILFSVISTKDSKRKQKSNKIHKGDNMTSTLNT